jgi:hypothetical protein
MMAPGLAVSTAPLTFVITAAAAILFVADLSLYAFVTLSFG